MSDLLPAINAEIAQLEAELERDARFIKLSRLKEIRELYAPKVVKPLPQSGSRVAAPVRTLKRSPNKSHSVRQRALDSAALLLAGSTEPVRTADILGALEADGIRINGQQPTSNLSAMLYHSPRFQSHGRAGWTLISDTEEAGTRSAAGQPSPEEPAADEGPGRINGWSH